MPMGQAEKHPSHAIGCHRACRQGRQPRQATGEEDAVYSQPLPPVLSVSCVVSLGWLDLPLGRQFTLLCILHVGTMSN